jgi:hypothetical protein
VSTAKVVRPMRMRSPNGACAWDELPQQVPEKSCVLFCRQSQTEMARWQLALRLASSPYFCMLSIQAWRSTTSGSEPRGRRRSSRVRAIRWFFSMKHRVPSRALVQSPRVQSPKSSGSRASDLRPWTLDTSRVPSRSFPSPVRFGWTSASSVEPDRVGVRGEFANSSGLSR